ncbi:MAG TPA: 50S ribosomal protein L2, partial [Candidatus Nanoarchaeia archaeon]|nr:50S ribosomal protein L2 [Candidatus Nanoarchaeia archaeon]
MTTVSFRQHITTNEPHKALTHGFRRPMGRNNMGRITMNHKGGGHKRLFRDIDFVMNKVGVPGVIQTVEYDPNRSGFIGLVHYKDGDKRYILIPKNVRPGQEIMTAENAPISPANRLPLKEIPLGTFVYNIEIKAGGGAKMARSAGNYAEIIAKDGGFAHLKLPSTEVRKVSELAWASVGEVSNDENRLVQLGKAGRSRWLGIRP